ncbi:hypothetical protein [Singulisphaera acidiphila]|uniref:Uncharacterized protein n=1 Tax=Singulisphaera acidiphila (strain ATCC BAA-1392 / DSM 18658 / VKM B-2454 / MOB10) TaxID=886293 RepID=L0DP47_SINAD|nr:hypothetical protein [Singulisphaera acidiphila]AGA31149.1 hypothetical protein Sinac_7095 [Singulisphaera acidiphila DSM 18658]
MSLWNGRTSSIFGTAVLTVAALVGTGSTASACGFGRHCGYHHHRSAYYGGYGYGSYYSGYYAPRYTYATSYYAPQYVQPTSYYTPQQHVYPTSYYTPQQYVYPTTYYTAGRGFCW